AGEFLVEAVNIDEITGVRQGDMGGEAAIHVDAEGARPHAEMLLARLAHGAGAAADPGIDQTALADEAFGGVGAYGDHRADDLMTQHMRQRSCAGHVKALAAAQVEIAIGEMKVAMADAAGSNPDDDF